MLNFIFTEYAWKLGYLREVVLCVIVFCSLLFPSRGGKTYVFKAYVRYFLKT